MNPTIYLISMSWKFQSASCQISGNSRANLGYKPEWKSNLGIFQAAVFDIGSKTEWIYGF